MAAATRQAVVAAVNFILTEFLGVPEEALSVMSRRKECRRLEKSQESVCCRESVGSLNE